MNLNALRAHSGLLSGLADAELEFLESVSREVRFRSGDVVFEEEGVADTFYIILEGKVGLEMTIPGRHPVVIQTLGSGDLLGLSWLFPPHRWNWRARAVADTTVATFDGTKVRAEAKHNRQLECQLLRVVGEQARRRLHSTRLQLLDLYREGER